MTQQECVQALAVYAQQALVMQQIIAEKEAKNVEQAARILELEANQKPPRKKRTLKKKP